MKNGKVIVLLLAIIASTDYGRPMKAFSLKSRTFGLGKKIGQINSALGVFSDKLSAPILVQ